MGPHSLGRHVLVVEDDEGIRQGLVLTLQRAGYGVREAANGEEALAALSLPPPPSAILLDVVMPVMNGWEFLRERESLPPHIAAIPVIIFSATMEAVPRMKLPRGVVKALPKPVRWEEVLAALSDILQALEEQQA